MKEIDDNYIKAAAILYQTCNACFPKYTSPFSPRKFTVPQVRVLTWLRILPDIAADHLRTRLPELNAYLDGKLCQIVQPLRLPGKMSYRRVVKILSESQKLRDALELSEVPHYSTLCHAERHNDEIR